MSMKPASNRNRHTGRINAYKRDVMEKHSKQHGDKLARTSDGTVYAYARVGLNVHNSGLSIVRV